MDDIGAYKFPSITSAVQFESNKNFLKNSQQQNEDSGILGYERRFGHKAPTNKLGHRETLLTLLSHDEVGNEGVEQLLNEDINYRDLASLSETDLELCGFKPAKHRKELLKLFEFLPNQDPSYEYICNTTEAEFYNNKILNNVASHLEAMRSSFAATNYKLLLMPPDDILVGDKSYASRFALEALAGLRNVHDDIEKDLNILETLTGMQSKLDQGGTNKKKPMASKFRMFWLSSFAVGLAIAIWIWKIKTSNVNRLT